MDYQDSASFAKPAASPSLFSHSTNVAQATLPDISMTSLFQQGPVQRETEILSQHRYYDQRIKTFQRWPKSMIITAPELCAAGFIYSGYGDMVKCVFCRGKLSQFETSDIPIVEHARHFPQCEFIRTMMPDNAAEIKNVSLINIAGCKKLLETTGV